MNYIFEEKEKQGWVIGEEQFQSSQLGKCESIFYLGNGYMGVRSATEEKYLQETRGMFVSGTFNKFDTKEVTELPNLPDVIGMEIFIDEERLDLSSMPYTGYERLLNMKQGELTRTFEVSVKSGKRVSFCFKRIVSLEDRHMIAQRVEVYSDSPLKLAVKSGIDGKITNSGFQHLSVRNKRFFDGRLLQANYRTTQSQIDISINTIHQIYKKEKNVTDAVVQKLEMDSRSIYMNYQIETEAGEYLAIEKISAVYTSRDIEFVNQEQSAAAYAREMLGKDSGLRYEQIAQKSAEIWKKRVWENQDIEIVSDNPLDQLAVRFAIFHMNMMTPGHDNRMNIGAKALSGEGYKGHTFWDTEMFLLPFWIYTYPDVAKSLLEYRYHGLDGARRKARENGYKGAMYPWESAWITDGEVTPKFGAADVVTGKEMPIICGDLEQHITADVAFGVWEYYQITGDKDFMERCGYEIIFETANYWASRVEWNADNMRYEIHDVIGPDEYSEHADNNAYTNYMAHWNMRLAIMYWNQLKQKDEKKWKELSDRLELSKAPDAWKEKADGLYLPCVNEELLLPQDDAYLTYPVIDLKKYKESKTRADIIKDYNMEQLAHMQVSKQADVLVLFYIMESLFPKEVKEKNFYYYEDKCLHDSSLSLSTHAIIASDLGEKEMAYQFFQKAAMIDMGPDMNTPKDGIHAASMGGIWQCVINGFCGVRMIDGKLRINPNLPPHWKKASFNIKWRGVKLHFAIDAENVRIDTAGGETELVCADAVYHVCGRKDIAYTH